MTPTSTRALILMGLVFRVLATVIREKTLYLINQLLTFEVLDMTLISAISPRSLLVFSSGYHAISNTSIVNNRIIVVSLPKVNVNF